MLHVGYSHVTYVYDVSHGKAGNRRGQSSVMPCTPPRPTAATGSYLQPCSWCATASWKKLPQNVCLVTLWYYGLHLSFVWLPDTHLYSNPLYSSNVYFSVNCITKPAVQQNLLKTKASKHHGTIFHKNIDFIGTASILQHSCPIVFSMIFALRR